MNAKILNLFLMIFVAMVISGCTTTVANIHKVPTVIACEVETPSVCHYGKTTYTEEITQMRKCIKAYGSLIQACKGGK